MSARKSRKISQFSVKKSSISVINVNGEDYISLTEMAQAHGGSELISKWLSNKNTIEFLGVWESLNNVDNFNYPEFGVIKSEAGSNRFTMSVKQWTKQTGAIGLQARTGRYGGTFAHRDIAFEFGGWLSPEFKLLVIKEFQRLKQKEKELEQWDYRRFLASVNYTLQTDAVKEVILPKTKLPESKQGIIYASEADVLNVALFGITAAEWRRDNKKKAKQGENIRDYASIEQLTVLSNLESLNSMYINRGIEQTERLKILRSEATRQLEALLRTKRNVIPPSEVKKLQDKQENK